MTAPYGMTDTGFNAKTLTEILTDSRTKILALISPFLAFLPDDPLSQMNDLFSDMESQLWEQMELLYNSPFLTASGVSLDMLGASRAMPRLQSTFPAVYDYEVVTSGDVTIPYDSGTGLGQAFNSTVNGSPIFQNNAVIALIGAGTHKITLYSRTAGATNIDPLTMKTTLTGIPTLTNLVSGSAVNSFFVEGLNAESDADYRTRLGLRSNINVYTQAGIENAVLSINDALIAKGAKALQGVKAITNNRTYLVDGQKPKSVQLVIYYLYTGTDYDDVTETDAATAFAMAKAGGIETSTTTASNYTKTVTLGGQAFEIEVSRADQVPVYLIINTTPALSSSQKALLKTAIKSWGDKIGLGNDVTVYGANSLSEVLNTFVSPVLTDYEIKIGIAPAPTTDDNIDLAAKEVSTWDIANFTIGDL